MKKRALISVSKKDGAVDFAKGLVSLGYEIISTGGTEKALKEAGIATVNISDITGFPECLDGRVKTLHPAVHAGLLAMRGNKEHMRQLAELNINTVDVVAVNLYPFKETVLKSGAGFEEAVENIDIGGPTMLRSAAKNYQDVLVVVDPSDYSEVLTRLGEKRDDIDFRKKLMYKVFAHTAVYDSMISNYLASKINIEYPESVTFAYEKAQDLRYGENPHQSAAFYREVMPAKGSLAEAEQLWGKELSYNNINDANGAIDLLKEFDEPTAVASKHANPCGVASADTAARAYKLAYECDPVSIFGGIVAVNREIDAECASEMVKTFLEIIIAPSYSAEALSVLKTKKNLRILKLKDVAYRPQKALDMKKVYGGLLVQQRDESLFEPSEVKCVTKRQPTKEELKQLEFAYKVVKHTKSNGIAVAKNFMAIGVGPGQTNRIWAAQQAIEHAGDRVAGAVLASDAFFPFGDCAEAAANAGITAVIQPGGSVRDQESIDVCDKHGLAMIFVGERHFKH